MRLADLCLAAVIPGGADAARAQDDAGLRAAFPVAPARPLERELVILRRDGTAGSWMTEDDPASRVEERLEVLTLARARARLRALGR